MKRRRILVITTMAAGIVLLVVFLVFGLPFINDMQSTPIPGLPPAGGSLRERYTQTALAKQPEVRNSQTPTLVAGKNK